MKVDSTLPGSEILETGLRDLENGAISDEALLVAIGRERLITHGFTIILPANMPEIPEHALYASLQKKHAAEAIRHYRSLIRKLVSLENALDAVK